MTPARKAAIAACIGGFAALASCAPRPSERPGAGSTDVVSETSAPPGAATPLPAGGTLYRIEPSESLLTILVYRAGALARAGHNHVIASHDVTGSIRLAEDVTASSFELRFPVGSLTVDEPALREAEGAEFPPDVPASAQEGTRRNMLGAALLDAESFPEIVVRSEAIERSAETLVARVAVSVRDQTRTVTAPFRYETDANGLIATGELTLAQSELGLTPFSALMGALRVRDEMSVKLRISARRAP